MSPKILSNEIEAIVIDLILSGLWNMIGMDEPMVKIITETVFCSLQQVMRIHRRAMDENDNEEMVELRTYSEVSSLLKT